jgi:hypothetical protein
MNSGKNMHSVSGLGAVTLFVVLLILCLTVFSVLAFASANADRRLSEKNSEMVKAYYSADSTAALISADVTSFWKAGEAKPGGRAAAELEAGIASYAGTVYADVHDSGDGLTVSYGVFVDTLLTLEVELSLPDGGVCEVLSWRVMADETDFGEDTLPVWEG